MNTDNLHYHIVHAPPAVEAFKKEWYVSQSPFRNPLLDVSDFIKDLVISNYHDQCIEANLDEVTLQLVNGKTDEYKHYREDVAHWKSLPATYIQMQVDWRIQYAEIMLATLESKGYEKSRLTAVATS